jgi:deoxyadenosine/deoxycytidine kinase
VRNNALFALWRPHLVIYLDVPVDETRRRIEARNLPNEKDSMLTTPAYLQALVDSYKKDYLKDIRYFFIISPEEFSYFNKSFIDT